MGFNSGFKGLISALGLERRDTREEIKRNKKQVDLRE
jgi:hypothetical protein